MKTEELLKIIDDNVDKLPEILSHLSLMLDSYRSYCKQNNDNLKTNALGSACQLLAMKRRPPDREMKKFCSLIKEAQFPNGLERWHHQGEINFYNRFLKEEK